MHCILEPSMNNSETENETAKEIKSMLVSNYNFIDPSDVRITYDIDSYHPGSARQAGSGEVSCFVLVSAPEVPQIKSDDYYQRNPQRRKPTEESVEKTKERLELIRNACKTVAGIFEDAEYVEVSEYEGYDSSHGNEQYMNIRIR